MFHTHAHIMPPGQLWQIKVHPCPTQSHQIPGRDQGIRSLGSSPGEAPAPSSCRLSWQQLGTQTLPLCSGQTHRKGGTAQPSPASRCSFPTVSRSGSSLRREGADEDRGGGGCGTWERTSKKNRGPQSSTRTAEAVQTQQPHNA